LIIGVTNNIFMERALNEEKPDWSRRIGDTLIGEESYPPLQRHTDKFMRATKARIEQLREDVEGLRLAIITAKEDRGLLSERIAGVEKHIEKLRDDVNGGFSDVISMLREPWYKMVVLSLIENNQLRWVVIGILGGGLLLNGGAHMIETDLFKFSLTPDPPHETHDHTDKE
jgi:hypothetical protein